MKQNNHSANGHSSHGDHEEIHVTPFDVYVKVFAALIVLTILTVGFHVMHLGALATPIAFLIASTKAFLVMAWFMHLKHEGTLNRVIFGSGFFFLAVLLAFCLIDILTRVMEVSTL
jgi:cytochrome c oxidase subunit 4